MQFSFGFIRKNGAFDALVAKGKATTFKLFVTASYTNCTGAAPVDTYAAGFIKAVPNKKS